MKKLFAIIAISALFALSYADMQADSLTAHNNERNAYGIPSLTWSSSLAQTAQAYAETMAATGTTSHSKGRVNVGENLAWGSGKSVDTTYLAGLWLAEKEFYIPGVDFPDCSTTGSWHDVAHYTQLMWEKTTQVGCGLAQGSSGMNYYVCHYSPQGNMVGESVYTKAASISTTTTPATTATADTAATSTSTASSTNTSPSTSPSTTQSSSPSSSGSGSGSSSQFISDCLAAHNNERNAYGIPSLTWSDSLAQGSQAYAQVMAATGTTAHSSKSSRPGIGENLAWGSGPGVNTDYLAGLWLAEKRYFISGVNFPDCSTTGNWDSVSHYTQLMWRKTTQVGCGLAQGSSGRWNYVCRYSPAGNMDGEPVY